MKHDYAIETLRQEYYRIAQDVRRVPCEQFAYGFTPDREERKQADIVDALLALGAEVTAEMLALKVVVHGKARQA